MFRKPCLSLAIAFCIVAGVARAQEKKPVPPPPKLVDEGPSLESTMKFIQDKMNGQDRVDYVDTQSNLPGVTYRRHEEMPDVLAEPATCTLRVNITIVTDLELEDGANYRDPAIHTPDDLHSRSVVTQTLSLKDIERITVESRQDAYNRMAAEEWHSKLTFTITPTVFVLELYAPKPSISHHYSRTRGKQPVVVSDLSDKKAEYVFVDEDLANRVAKALTHAVELCGGGNKDPF
jgi:hypothetical protein